MTNKFSLTELTIRIKESKEDLGAGVSMEWIGCNFSDLSDEDFNKALKIQDIITNNIHNFFEAFGPMPENGWHVEIETAPTPGK